MTTIGCNHHVRQRRILNWIMNPPLLFSNIHTETTHSSAWKISFSNKQFVISLVLVWFSTRKWYCSFSWQFVRANSFPCANKLWRWNLRVHCTWTHYIHLVDDELGREHSLCSLSFVLRSAYTVRVFSVYNAYNVYVVCIFLGLCMRW